MATSALDTSNAELAREVARLTEENARLRCANMEKKQSASGKLIDVPPGLEAPTMSGFGEVDTTWFGAAAAAQCWQDAKFCYTWPYSAAPTDAGSLMSSTLTSSLVSSCNSECEIVEEEARTTLIMRNIPNGYKRQQLLELLDSQGFAGRYNFMYLPIDFNTAVGFGYAFVNFVDEASAELLLEKLQGYHRWPMPSEKVLAVDWCASHQGLSSHLERYRNSPVMHESVADEFKPMLFKDGKRIAFPRPTRKLKTPRVRADRK